MGELLISKGANLNAIDIGFQKKLILLLMKKTLIKERKFIKMKETPVFYAAKKYSQKMMKTLISKGADLTIVNNNIILN